MKTPAGLIWKIYRAVAIAEGEEAIKAALALVSVEPTEARVKALWLERCRNRGGGDGVKIYMTENEGCFAFDMTAETMADAALLAVSPTM